MFENPQSKLNLQANQKPRDTGDPGADFNNQQSGQPDLNSKQQDGKGTIEQNQQSKPINSTPDKSSRLEPDTNPKLNDQASSTITDEAGNKRTVPEAESESGFKATLKKKLMGTVTSKMTESNSAENANGDLKGESQPTKDAPANKQAPGAKKPNPPIAKPQQPSVPSANYPSRPKLPQKPRGFKMPRVQRPRF